MNGDRLFWWIVFLLVTTASFTGFVLSFVWDSWLLILVWVPLLFWAKELWEYIHDKDEWES